MNPFAKMVESLLESKASRRARKRMNQGKPISPQPDVAAAQRKITPVDRRGPGGATGGTDELGRPLKPTTPTPATPAAPESPAEPKPVVKPMNTSRLASRLKANNPSKPQGSDRDSKRKPGIVSKVDTAAKKADQTVDRTLGGKKLV